jgi:hypothetical protein
MMLSHNFRTRITSGYLKGTKTTEVEAILGQLQTCSRGGASHPLLLPALFLAGELSAENDNHQRDIRASLRSLEESLVQRYVRPVMAGQAARQTDEQLLTKGPQLDTINGQLADLHCMAMWKRPQAWRSVVGRAVEAAEMFWEVSGEDVKTAELRRLHGDVCRTLRLLMVKLEGLESYTHVSLERLSLQRQVVCAGITSYFLFKRVLTEDVITQMDSIVNLRESTVSTILAAQQKRLAEVTRRDGASMKTLAFLGSLFLPGTFLASIFSMSFFDFGGGMNGSSVSTGLWIYFVVMMPLTGIIVGTWWMFDRHSNKENRQDWHDIEAGMDAITAQAMRSVQNRTGTSTF